MDEYPTKTFTFRFVPFVEKRTGKVIKKILKATNKWKNSKEERKTNALRCIESQIIPAKCDRRCCSCKKQVKMPQLSNTSRNMSSICMLSPYRFCSHSGIWNHAHACKTDPRQFGFHLLNVRLGFDSLSVFLLFGALHRKIVLQRQDLLLKNEWKLHS